MGIRRLSEVSFGSGMFIMLTCLFMDNTAYLLDLLVQSFGFFWQTFVQLMWHTDVFERLGPAYGSEDRGRFIPDGFQVNIFSRANLGHITVTPEILSICTTTDFFYFSLLKVQKNGTENGLSSLGAGG